MQLHTSNAILRAFFESNTYRLTTCVLDLSAGRHANLTLCSLESPISHLDTAASTYLTQRLRPFYSCTCPARDWRSNNLGTVIARKVALF